ncbi:hypothetical protein FRC02_010584 [Tulasnella sp. 418]|nr:hypothetical protein FRC02_010584 [Tulasnella sp. 418]
MPTRSKTSAIATMEDARFDKFFEEVIASPELNLLSDDFEQIDTTEDAIFAHQPSYPISHQHPILHRLQPVIPPPISILKSHVIPQPISTPSTGGISPTLTWSGDASPSDQSNSPGLHDMDEDDFVNLGGATTITGVAATTMEPESNAWNTPLFNSGANGARTSSRRNSSATRSTRSRDSSHSRSRSSCSVSVAGGDEDALAMSNLSIASSTSTHVDQDGSTTLSFEIASPPARKKARTTSRSSVDSILMEISGHNATNRLVPTGHRRNITSASLVPLDAPTQVRHYLTPSSTSKKETPSAFIARKNKLKAKEATLRSKKRSRDGEDDGHDEVIERDELINPDTEDVSTEQTSLLSAIEAKRRQNTLAARRSRQRKLDYVRNLEELLGVLTRERDEWKERAEKAEIALGGPVMDDDE